ncbi:hypothetical protein G4228_020167 [Cervus hanglu yarkandensis]|uniref:Uncharacterized protein n=1 Tax=Cervus hanglu yarkandensis TaxID=84702 RepID=A0A833RZR1_9CERV|nr:hypothetical protein G4228_020167 [Cervus hanglu yarkandensis]
MDLAWSDIRILMPKSPIKGTTAVDGFQDESPENLYTVEQGPEDTVRQRMVSRVFWPGTFTQEVTVYSKELASCNPVVLEESKSLVRCNMKLELEQANELECEGLKKIWRMVQGMDSMLKYLQRKIEEF